MWWWTKHTCFWIIGRYIWYIYTQCRYTDWTVGFYLPPSKVHISLFQLKHIPPGEMKWLAKTRRGWGHAEIIVEDLHFRKSWGAFTMFQENTQNNASMNKPINTLLTLCGSEAEYYALNPQFYIVVRLGINHHYWKIMFDDVGYASSFPIISSPVIFRQRNTTVNSIYSSYQCLNVPLIGNLIVFVIDLIG